MVNSVYISDDEHDHNSTTKQRGLDPTIKQKINEWFENGITTTTRIEKKLLELGLKGIKNTQISSYLKQLCKKKTGPKFDYVALKAWCNNHSTIPSVQDMDKMFVARTEFNVNNYELVNFKILVTTRRLVGYALYSKC